MWLEFDMCNLAFVLILIIEIYNNKSTTKPIRVCALVFAYLLIIYIICKQIAAFFDLSDTIYYIITQHLLMTFIMSIAMFYIIKILKFTGKRYKFYNTLIWSTLALLLIANICFLIVVGSNSQNTNFISISRDYYLILALIPYLILLLDIMFGKVESMNYYSIYIALPFFALISDKFIFDTQITIFAMTLMLLLSRMGIMGKMIYTDKLTHLKNRLAFETYANNFTFSSGYAYVFYIDVNNLKKVNDTYGHLAGDRALKVIGDVIKKVFSCTDNIFRLGGDEFAVIFIDYCENLDELLIAKLLEELIKYNRINGTDYSVGIGARCVTECDDLRVVLDQADILMYNYKNSHRN